MRAILMLLVAASLAGCADDGSSGQEEPDAFNEIGGVESDKGVIRGVVVNQDFVPVEGATVALLSTELTATSDAEGAFVFQDIEPGTYFMETTAPSHNTVQSSEDVVAGVAKPKIHQIRLIYTPPPVPYVEEITHKFWMDGAINVIGNRVVLGNFLGQGTYGARLDFEANTTWVQSELTWGYAQPAAERMRMDTSVWDEENAVASGFAQGTSPVIKAFGAEEDLTNVIQSRYILWVAPGDPVPAGVTAGQELEMFLHVFHHFEPAEGWTFGNDGAPNVP